MLAREEDCSQLQGLELATVRCWRWSSLLDRLTTCQKVRKRMYMHTQEQCVVNLVSVLQARALTNMATGNSLPQ